MNFKEYRDSQLFERDLASCTERSYSQWNRRGFAEDAVYISFSDTSFFDIDSENEWKRERATLFSITCYFTMLVMRQVESQYSLFILNECCRVCRLPLFCHKTSNEVDPIFLLKKANLIPQETNVGYYKEWLDEAAKFFIPDFLAFFAEHEKLLYPEVLRSHVRAVDPWIIRKACENEVKFFSGWLDNQTPDCGIHQWEKVPEVERPERGPYALVDKIPLNSQTYKAYLKNSSIHVPTFDSLTVEEVLVNPAMAKAVTDFFSPEGLRVDNTVIFGVPCGLFANRSDAREALDIYVDRIAKIHRDVRTGQECLAGEIAFLTDDENLEIEFVRGSDQNVFDVVIYRFPSIAKYEKKPIPLLPLKEFEPYFFFGGAGHHNGMLRERNFAKALLGAVAYGVELNALDDGIAVMRRPRNRQELIKYFIRRLDAHYNFWTDAILDAFTLFQKLPAVESRCPSVQTSSIEMLGYPNSWDAVIRDLEEMVKAIDHDAAKIPVWYEYFPQKLRKYEKQVRNERGRIELKVLGSVNRDKVLVWMEQYKQRLAAMLEIINTELLPLEAEALKVWGHTVKKKFVVRYTIGYYFFQMIAADPLSYIDHEFAPVQECARLLMEM